MDEAYERLCANWFAGDRDREPALHLLFLCWWHWAGTEFLNAFSGDPPPAELWHEVFAHFGGEASFDAELLFVASIMTEVTPWAFGDEKVWAAAAQRMMARSLTLKPDGFSPEAFEGRSDYGDYFASQARTPRFLPAESALLGRLLTFAGRLVGTSRSRG